MHVEVGEADLRNEVVAADEQLEGVQPRHLEVLVPDVLVRPTHIYKSARFGGTFLRRDGGEGAPQAVNGLQRGLFDGGDLGVVLESG